MSQADGTIQNGTGSSVRTDLNNNFGALFTNSEGSTAPATTFECQLWADSGSDNALKIRNTANSAWYTIGSLDTANLGLATLSGPTFTGGVSIIDGTASAPAIKLANDTDTGIFGATGEVKVATAGNNKFTFSNTYFTASVPLSVADGSATAPSLTNTGDVNTGLYFPAADTVGVTTAGALQYSFDATSFEVKSQNEIRFNDDDNSNYIGIKAGTLSANQTFTLPTADGSDGQVIKTNGSGQLSFTTIGVPDGVPVGSVFCMATTTVPSGYLECDGSDVSRSTYSDLHAVLKDVGGTNNYGWGNGDGSSTFTLPDLRGEFVRGWSNTRTGAGVDEGRTFGSAQGHQLEHHNHTETQRTTNTASGGTGTGGIVGTLTTRTGVGGEAGVAGADGTFDGTAGSNSDETRPRNIAMMYVIKT
jgi:microcystin-dependent protein